MKILLDTHVWIWWQVQPRRISQKVLSLLSDPSGYEELLLSAISPWEFCKLLEKGRLGINCSPEEWLTAALDMPKLRIVPLSPRISLASTTLPGSFHNDPADQIIVASARAERATILTMDKRIRGYRHVKSLW